jgi:hypothetical protein
VRTYLITYDLNKPGQDYSKLFEAMKGLGAWGHHLDSTWIVKTNLSATQIRDRLNPPVIDPNDGLLVVRLQGDWASWMTPDTNEWLQKNITLE